MIKRNLLPGSEWLYCKLYTGIKSSDKILVELILPFCEKLRSESLIKEFFFIRYNDPKFHLRLRLKLTDENSFNGVMKEFASFFESAIEIGLIHKILFDIYVREIERYGEISIETVEKLFCKDSLNQIRLIEMLRSNGDSDRERWLSSLVMIDDLLTLTGYDLNEKGRVISEISNSFKQEFGITNIKSEQPINDKYRAHRKEIEDTLAHGEFYKKYEQIFIQRNTLLKNEIDILKKITKEQHPDFNELLPSLIHMMMNRLFRSNNRVCEMVVYYLLNKYYASQIAQLKYRK